MQKPSLTPAKIAKLAGQFEHCKAQLLELSWITQGSVFETQQGTWCWTRKVKAKTVTVALSAQQAELFQQAIAQHRKLEALLVRMRNHQSNLPPPIRPGTNSAGSDLNHPKPALSSRHS